MANNTEINEVLAEATSKLKVLLGDAYSDVKDYIQKSLDKNKERMEYFILHAKEFKETEFQTMLAMEKNLLESEFHTITFLNKRHASDIASTIINTLIEYLIKIGITYLTKL